MASGEARRRVHAGEHGFERAHFGEKAQVLEGAREAERRARGGLEPLDPLAAKPDLAGLRPREAGDEVEQAGLAGAVRTDQRVEGARGDGEVDAFERGKPAVAQRQAADVENRRLAHGRAPRRGMRQGSRPCGMNRTAITMMSPFTAMRASASGRRISGKRVRMSAPRSGAKGEPIPPSRA